MIACSRMLPRSTGSIVVVLHRAPPRSRVRLDPCASAARTPSTTSPTPLSSTCRPTACQSPSRPPSLWTLVTIFFCFWVWAAARVGGRLHRRRSGRAETAGYGRNLNLTKELRRERKTRQHMWTREDSSPLYHMVDTVDKGTFMSWVGSYGASPGGGIPGGGMPGL